ncbi:hypothetical protein Tco_1553478 [Tanacetum coccineum]
MCWVRSPIPPKTAEQKLARKNELKAKSTLLLAIPEHLLKFHGIKDAKTLWEAIKTRFGGNKESKEIEKEAILKVAEKSYIMLGTLKTFAKSETKSDLDTLSNGLFVQQFEDNTSSTNEAVNTAHDVSTARCHRTLLSSLTYADDVMFSFFANQSNSPQLDNEDLEQIDTNDLKEMDQGEEIHKEDKKGFEFMQRTTPANALVVTDGMGYDWSYQAEEGPTDFALMAHSSSGLSSSSSSDTEREVLNKANLEIIGYQLGLESLEARIVVHQKNEAVYEEDIAFLKYDVKVRDNSITELKNQLEEEALKEKDDLKLKLEKFETPSKNLTNLINSQISVNNKTSVSFNSQINENELHDIHINKSEVLESASDSSMNESEEDNNQVNDMYKAGEGYHAVPPPYTGNFMPPRPDLSFARLDDSIFKSTVSKTITSVHESETSASKTNKESMEKPKTVRPSFEQNKPSYAKINFVKSDENTRKSVIEQHTYRQAENLRKSQSSRVDKRNWNGMMTQKLGDGFEFKKKACYVMESQPYNTTDLITNSGKVPVNTAKQSFPIAAVSNSTARYVNTAASKPTVNESTPYELLISRPPNLDFMRPFGCPVTILNTLDHLGKFEGKADEGFLVGFTSVNNKGDDAVNKVSGIDDQERTDSSTLDVNTAGPSINTANANINTDSLNINIASPIPNDPSMPSLEETGIFNGAYDDEDVGAEANLNNLETTMNVSPIPTIRVHKDHPKEQIIGDLNLATQTRRMTNFSKENAMMDVKSAFFIWYYRIGVKTTLTPKEPKQSFDQDVEKLEDPCDRKTPTRGFNFLEQKVDFMAMEEQTILHLLLRSIVRGTVAIRGCWIEASGRLTCLNMIGGSNCY